MVTTVADIRAVESPVARLALLLGQTWGAGASAETCDPLVGEFLGVVKAVGNEEQALLLRQGRLLAWAKCHDVSEVGYPSWPAFLSEYSPWGESRTREYVRLAESGLDLIKEAASNNVIGLTLATRASRDLGSHASHEEQLAYISAATLRPLPKRRPSAGAQRRRGRWSGDEMRRIQKARRLAVILIGWEAPPPVVDAFILACCEQELTGDQILDQARAVPPRPERLDKVVPDWPNDPAASLVGPWVEPADVRDVTARLRALEVILDKRRVLLGSAYLLIQSCELWRSVPGCTSLADLCSEHLEIPQRTFQEYAGEGFDHECFPLLGKEIEAGRLSVDRASFAAARASNAGASLRQWLELVRHLGRVELERARAGNPRRDYARALYMAQRVERLRREAGGVAVEGRRLTREARAWIPDDAQKIDADAERVVQHLGAIGATGPLQIALRDQGRARSLPESRVLYGPIGLLEAADYLLAVVSLPSTHGVRRVVEQDEYTCQNPRCRRRTIRVHVHHIDERQHGGTDDPSNVVTLCPACHLRGIHSGRMSVIRIGGWLVWSWPSGGVVIMDSP